jgi:GNAT superfamily N-acetyltransferase
MIDHPESHEKWAASECRFRIRDASAGDIPAIRGLFAEHLAALGYEPDPALDADMDGFPATYAGGGSHFIVAEDGSGEIAGMAGLKEGEIRRLYVKPSHRRRGLAGMLVQSLIERHRDGGPLFAVIASANPAAKAVFASLGFSATGGIPAHPKMKHCEILQFQAKLI